MLKDQEYEKLFLANIHHLEALKWGYAEKIRERLKGRYSISYIYKVKRGTKKSYKILEEFIKLSKEEIENYETNE